MMPGLEALACPELAVPRAVMEHVVRVESSFNPYAIGVVGARLVRQPRGLAEAVATASRLEGEGYNFSLGLAQVNRHNLSAQGLTSYELAFSACPNLAAGARILADCHRRAAGDWGKALSCYYSGNFSRGFRDGYVQKVYRSMAAAGMHPPAGSPGAIPLVDEGQRQSPERVPGELRRRRAGSSDQTPFVPQVSLPGTRSAADRAPEPRLDPAPEGNHGSASDAAFVF